MDRPVFAQRELYVRGNPQKKVLLRILGPTESDPDFLVQIDGVDLEKFPTMVGGCDSLQAFMHTALFLKSFVDDINRDFFNGELRWLDDEDISLGIYKLEKK